MHERRHTKERPYSCSQCGKTFSEAKSLKDHASIHTNERPHHCPQCGKNFRLLSTFRTHERIHNETPKFRCHTCHKGFHQASNWKRHQLKCSYIKMSLNFNKEIKMEESAQDTSNLIHDIQKIKQENV